MDLLAIDTTNGNEEEAADYLIALFKEHHILTKKVIYAEGRANCGAEIGEGDDVLALTGHIDVVEAGDVSQWSSPPFTPTIKDGTIVARGASDMKSGLAGLAIAMIELAEEKVPLGGRVRFIGTVSEEIGLAGAKQVTKLGYANDIRSMIIGEPSGGFIAYAHRGVLNYTVTSHGKIAHSSMPENGINAIDNLLVFYNELRRVFGGLTAKNEALENFVYNSAIIEGGSQLNIIPDKASLQMNIRTIPEVNNELLKETLQDIVDRLNASDEKMNLELHIDRSTLPVFSDKNSKIVTTAYDEAQKGFGREFPLVGSPGGTDAAEFVRGNPDMQVILLGPGNDTAHQVDEYVEIDEYLRMIDVYKNIITAYFK